MGGVRLELERRGVGDRKNVKSAVIGVVADVAVGVSVAVGESVGVGVGVSEDVNRCEVEAGAVLQGWVRKGDSYQEQD